MTTIEAALPRHIGPLRTVRHSLSLAWRSLIKTRKNPESLVDVTIQPIIFLILFVFLFGGAISGSWQNYLQYMVPGMMVMNTIMASTSTGVSLNTDVNQGVFDRFRSLPIARSAPLIGAVLGDIVRYIVALAVLLGFAAILGFRVSTNLGSFVAAIALMVLFGLCMCWTSVFVGMLVKSTGAVNGILIPISMLFSFGSNVFVGTATLPDWLQAWVRINPVTNLADAARGLLLGGPIVGPLLVGLAWMVGIVLVFFPLAVRAYRRRVG